ncbi:MULTISPECIES: LodA/GoxA family CTQ-dependent oxidase [unclassified Corallococcus]|uniref:LodA/GoxA family CTQ-dependent oxidase n=1 Tax=unclassified Corallococcus TaxID=2685029 RepID=UPI001A90475F|nr:MULTISPECIES: LodA/GoxA family CTQ-dependent oxidase [unclassified Corallococcus]MBN9687580.1 LodA/GoxA family CTQ-dependent oxidase [Corallococcus sp. NCSPR001]WAS88600.1 LodA/GoxA family CTQ-dependent oxidase [Corallococcus sp. NCRR]
MSPTYRIHPAIGIARVGNSEDYYLGPVTAGGLPLEKDGQTEVKAFRDAQGGIRRQAARFQVFVYDDQSPQGRPVALGQDVQDVQWTVHVANKKAAWYEFQQLSGVDGNHGGQPLRNPRIARGFRNALIIDPGPRTVAARGSAGLPSSSAFDAPSAPRGYPVNFPEAGLVPENSDITTLGQLSVDAQGRMDFRGGYGRSGCSTRWMVTTALLNTVNTTDSSKSDYLPPGAVGLLRQIADIGYATEEAFRAAIIGVLGQNFGTALAPTVEAIAYEQPRIDNYANNNYWWDDTSDGPVSARVVLPNGTPVEATPAWVMVAPPAYAPQILNMVTLYDTIYDALVRSRNLAPDLYGPNGFNPNYVPNYQAEIRPILARPSIYQWVANINSQGTAGHDGVVRQDGSPSNFFGYLRQPGHENDPTPGLMPKLAGDDPLQGEPNVIPSPPSKYLTLTRTQYFLLQQFSQQVYSKQPPPASTLGPGEQWDRGVLENCVGGPFCPGIEMTWLCRDPAIYEEPFRIKPMPSTGNSGLQWDTEPTAGHGLQPGDATKYMALPWQADFNECSNQTTDYTNLWWWPAQRPYFVSYMEGGQVKQDYWTRPAGANFVVDETMVFNWKDLGFILKQSGTGPLFLEVERRPLEHKDGTA